MSETLSPDVPRRRAPSRDVILRREALAVVRPLSKQIGSWQVTAARLISIGEHARAHGGYAPSHVEELDALDHMIATHRARLDAAVASLPDEIRTHGRIADTQRALESLTVATARAHDLLRPGR